MAIVTSIWASIKQWHAQNQMCHCLNDAGTDLILLFRLPASFKQCSRD